MTLLSDQSVHGCNIEIARLGQEKQKLQDAENTAKHALNPKLSDDDRRSAEMASTSANGKARQEISKKLLRLNKPKGAIWHPHQRCASTIALEEQRLHFPWLHPGDVSRTHSKTHLK